MTYDDNYNTCILGLASGLSSDSALLNIINLSSYLASVRGYMITKVLGRRKANRRSQCKSSAAELKLL